MGGGEEGRSICDPAAAGTTPDGEEAAACLGIGSAIVTECLPYVPYEMKGKERENTRLRIERRTFSDRIRTRHGLALSRNPFRPFLEKWTQCPA